MNEKFEKVLKDSRLSKMYEYSKDIFWPQLKKKHRLKDFPFQKFLDRDDNTPLHLAAMNNNEPITFKLVTKYENSLEAKNADGIGAKDIGKWHP